MLSASGVLLVVEGVGLGGAAAETSPAGRPAYTLRRTTLHAQAVQDLLPERVPEDEIHSGSVLRTKL